MNKRRNNKVGHQLTKKKRRKTTKKQVRNWLDLPTDIMLLIFMKLGPSEIILNAQKVCSSWRKLAKEPRLFRTIIVPRQQDHFRSYEYSRLPIKLRMFYKTKFEMFFKEAADRSCGQLVKVSCQDLLTKKLLLYVLNKPNSLKSLQIGLGVVYNMTEFSEIIKMLSQLEELDISHAYFPCDQFELISLSCPKLTHFRVEYPVGASHSEPSEFDEHAFAITKSMPHLHSLHLFRSGMTNKGLRAIREGFPNLEYLDVRRNSYKLILQGDLFEERVCRYRNIRISNEQTRRRSSIAITGAPITWASHTHFINPMRL